MAYFVRLTYKEYKKQRNLLLPKKKKWDATVLGRLFINENRNLKIKINMQTFSRAPIPIIGLTERPPDKGNRGKNDRWWSSNNKIFFLRWIWPKQINLLRFLILLRGHFLWKFRMGNVSDTIIEIYEKFYSVERDSTVLRY